MLFQKIEIKIDKTYIYGNYKLFIIDDNEKIKLLGNYDCYEFYKKYDSKNNTFDFELHNGDKIIVGGINLNHRDYYEPKIIFKIQNYTDYLFVTEGY